MLQWNIYLSLWYILTSKSCAKVFVPVLWGTKLGKHSKCICIPYHFSTYIINWQQGPFLPTKISFDYDMDKLLPAFIPLCEITHPFHSCNGGLGKRSLNVGWVITLHILLNTWPWYGQNVGLVLYWWLNRPLTPSRWHTVSKLWNEKCIFLTTNLNNQLQYEICIDSEQF